MRNKSIESAFEIMMIDQAILKSLKNGNINDERISKIQEKLIKDKRRYRQRLKDKMEPEYFRGTNGVIVGYGGEYDTYWTKVFFEGEIWTKEDMKEFEDFVWIHCTPSQYDCTGKLFTWAVSCFNTPRGVVAYVMEAIDV